MKKITIIIILFMICVSALFSEELESLAIKAWESSYNKTSLGLSKERQSLTKALNEIKGSAYSVTVSDDYSGNGFYLPAVSASVTYPEIADDLTISNTLSFGSASTVGTAVHSVRLDENNFYNLSLGTSLNKTFSLNENENDISDRIDELNERYKDNSERLNFINNYISSVSSILNLEHNILNAEKSYNRNLNNYETDLFSGDLVPNSTEDLRRQSELNKAKASIDEQKRSLVSLKNNFVVKFGTEYVDVTEIRDADLSFIIPENDEDITSYSVLNKKLKLEQVNEKIREKTDLKSKINLSGSLTPTVKFQSKGGYLGTDMSLTTGAQYQSSNWTVTLNVKENINDWKFSIPTVTISGKYEGGSKKSSVSELELKQLIYDLNDAEREYLDAVNNYRLNVSSLINDVDAFYNKSEYLKEVESTHQKILTYSQMLKDNNLIGDYDYEQAVNDTEEDAFNNFIHKLEGLQLEYKIKLINM